MNSTKTSANASDIESIGPGRNSQATASYAVAARSGAQATGTNSTATGRTINNVAPGVNSTDAVNVARLQGLQKNIDTVAHNSYSGIAMACALAGLPQVEQGKPFQLSAGV